MVNILVEMKRLKGTLFVLLFWASEISCSGLARRNLGIPAYTTLTRLIYALLTSFTMCSPITMRSAILVAPNFFFLETLDSALDLSPVSYNVETKEPRRLSVP
ncbi:hypothetical protein GGR55DRAFT_664580 [Xylaria sp. FL0064]|nr:hypothetical protein GGR55DRAFT_664580 [Xylaria sp. FL0064]